MHSTGKRTSLITFLGALCMLLSAVEYAIPKPVPFMRMGLANLPVLLALYIGLSTSEYFLLVTLKVLTQALISGTLFSYVFLFSLAGSFSSAFVMWLFSRCGHSGNSAGKADSATQAASAFKAHGRAAFSAVGISLGGALANNLAQIALSYLLLFGTSTRYIAPVLLITGAITATVLGLFVEAFMTRSKWFAAVKNGKTDALETVAESGTANSLKDGETASRKRQHGTLRFCISLCVMIAFLFVENLMMKVVLTIAFYIAARIRRKKVRILPSVIIIVTVTAAALLSPAGRVLVRLGNFAITEGALETGLARSFTLVGMVFLSQYATSGRIQLPGAVGALLESVFTWFSALSEKRHTFKKRKVIETLDNHLYSIFFQE